MASNTKQAKPKPSKAAGKGKRRDVNVGDLVSFESNLRHMTGNFGEVVAILDKDHAVVRGMGAHYVDYDNRYWVALTYKPTGINEDGDEWRDLHIWIRKVLYTRDQLPTKVKKKKKSTEPLVIEGHEQLLEVLTNGDDAKHVKVHFVPPQEEDH